MLGPSGRCSPDSAGGGRRHEHGSPQEGLHATAGAGCSVWTATVPDLADPENEVFFSAASVWELGLKIARGKLLMPADFVDTLRKDGFSDLAVTIDHADASLYLPRHHGDPFDRMLVAQALEEGLVLVSRDGAIADYEVPLLKA